VFGIIGNVGTPTGRSWPCPYALERQMLFFGAFTGANVLRNDPPDRYVFNYRASYVEETDAASAISSRCANCSRSRSRCLRSRTPMVMRAMPASPKAFRTLGVNDSAILRAWLQAQPRSTSTRPSPQLKAQKTPPKAIVMVGTYRACAKFIEKTRDGVPGADLHQRLVCRLDGAGRRV
jgi:hypothetical protein